MTKKVLLLLIVAAIGFVLVVVPVLAQDKVLKFQPQVEIPGSKFKPGEEITITKEGTSFAEYLKAFFDWAIRAIVIIGVVMIMVGGFQWMTAAGNAPKVGQAKARIISALIGIGLALGSYTILNFISPSLTRLEGIKLGEPLKSKEILAALSNSPCGKCDSNKICVYEVVEIKGAVRVLGCKKSVKAESDIQMGRYTFDVNESQGCGNIVKVGKILPEWEIGNKCEGDSKQCAVEKGVHDGAENSIKVLKEESAQYKGAACLDVAGEGNCTVAIKNDGYCIEAGTLYSEYASQTEFCKTGQCPGTTTICCKIGFVLSTDCADISEERCNNTPSCLWINNACEAVPG